MPSLYGIVTRGAPDQTNALLAQVLEAVPAGSNHTCHQRASAQAGLLVSTRSTQGGIAASDTHWLAFLGQVVEDDDYRKRLSRLPVQTPESFCEQLLALYTYLGVEALQGLNGQYALAVWEERTQRMLLINDRYGLQPFYIWRGPHEFAFSTHLRAIAAHPAFRRQVNPVALVDLLASGQMLGDNTLYAGVRAVPPATRLLFEAGYLVMEPYARLPFYTPGWSDPEPQSVVEGLDGYLHEAVRRRARDGTRLLLTGGMDSRLLAGYLGEQRNGLAFSTSTIGQPRSRDVLLAQSVAEQAGLPHYFTPANPGYLRDNAARCVQVTEGNLNVHAAWIFGEEEDLSGHPAAALMTGAGAEGISGRHVLIEQSPENEQQALNWLFNHHWQYPQAAPLLRPELQSALAESQARVSQLLRTTQADLFASRLDEFHYRLMHRHPTGSLLNEVIDVQEPYLDNDLVNYTLGLPPQMRQRGKLFQELLARRFPRLAALPGAKTQPRRSMLQRAWGKMGFFLKQGAQGDDPSHAIFYNDWLRNAARTYVTGLLTRGDLLGDYFEMRAVRRLLDEHMTGRTDAYRPIGALLTFAEWRKQFS